MRLSAWAWLALSSVWLCSLTGATRPRYGGTLTVELSSVVATLDPATLPAEFAPSIAETLVTRNERGFIQPQLAVAWQHDSDDKRWRFSLRPNVAFHDGAPLTASSAEPSLVAALKKKYGDITITSGGQALLVQSERPIPDLLSDLARPETAIVRRSDTSPLIGTGPFRVVRWEAGRRVTLAAFEDYWGGRPFLDSVIVNFAPGLTRSDVFDIPFASARRVLPEGIRIWSSPPAELLAILAANPQSTLVQALSLAIDRAPLVNVLTQKRGEAAFGLLPQWLSGYAFLFQMAPDAARARQMIAQLRLPPISLAYPPNDSFARAIAERIALNARDAGIVLQPGAGAGGNLTLIRWPIESSDAAENLKRLSARLGIPERAASIDAAKPESLYAAERALLDDQRIIPLLHIPKMYGFASRVRGWEAAQKTTPFRLNLESLWVSP